MKQLLFFLFIFLAVLTSKISSQCLTPDNTSLPQWQQGTIVNFNIASSIGSNEQKNQIRTAVSNWNSSNLSGNCSNVQFVESSTGVRKLKFENFNGNNSLAPARLGDMVFIGDDLTEATIYYNLNYTLTAGPFYDSTKSGYSHIFTKMTMHEIGHTMGLSHYTTGYPSACTEHIAQSSVMNSPCGINDAGNSSGTIPGDIIPTSVKACDITRLNTIYTCVVSTPTPIPTPIDYPPTCGIGSVSPSCAYNSYEYCICQTFAGVWDDFICKCDYYSPVIIDVNGNGFNLTNGNNGVDFDIDADGTTERIAWTSANSDDAWLVFDRNGNGLIDNGQELFGNFTPQPESAEKNGFLALAEYDKSANGGNGDGVISNQDSIFFSLRLWQDTNHNGISESTELKILNQVGLAKINLDYKVSKRTDEHGNKFRYRAKVRDTQGNQIGRWAWDVFLKKGQ